MSNRTIKRMRAGTKKAAMCRLPAVALTGRFQNTSMFFKSGRVARVVPSRPRVDSHLVSSSPHRLTGIGLQTNVLGAPGGMGLSRQVQRSDDPSSLAATSPVPSRLVPSLTRFGWKESTDLVDANLESAAETFCGRQGSDGGEMGWGSHLRGSKHCHDEWKVCPACGKPQKCPACGQPSWGDPEDVL